MMTKSTANTNVELGDLEPRLRKGMAQYLGHFSHPIAEIFEADRSAVSDLLLVNQNEDVWGDPTLEGAALDALDRLRDRVRKVIDVNLDDFLADFGYSVAGVLTEDDDEPKKKKPRLPKKRRG